MEDHKKHAVEEDKFKKKSGRKAFQENEETHFLDKEALDDDLIDIPDKSGDSRIVNSEHPENQEWNVRKEQNKDLLP